jgi:hypothetical protein
MEPVSTGLSFLKPISEGLQWLWRKRQAPWSDVPLRANVRHYEGPWYRVALSCPNDKPYPIEVLTVRTVKPKGLPLRPNTGTPQQHMWATLPKKTLNLQWTIAEKNAVISAFDCVIFVNLENRHGDLSIDFELSARLLNNRRPEIRVRVRTNSVKLR